MYKIGAKLIMVTPAPYSYSMPIGSICKLIRSYMDDHMFCEIVSLPASYQPSESRPKQVGDIILTRVDHWKLNTPKIQKARKCQHS